MGPIQGSGCPTGKRRLVLSFTLWSCRSFWISHQPLSENGPFAKQPGDRTPVMGKPGKAWAKPGKGGGCQRVSVSMEENWSGKAMQPMGSVANLMECITNHPAFLTRRPCPPRGLGYHPGPRCPFASNSHELETHPTAYPGKSPCPIPKCRLPM